ncbi:MAG: T9SS type A sorting domain-containing protein [Brumimicrobium sp.]
MIKIIARYIFFVVLIFIPFYSQTQILDTNTIWSESNIKYTYIANDTVSIDGKVYHEINSHSDTTFHYNNDNNQPYLIREDVDKVFWRESFLNDDYLLYDFSLSEGDSIYVTPMTYESMDSVLLYCDKVDTVEVFGIMRRRLTMITVNPNSFYVKDTEYWYYGIGSDLGLFKSGLLGTEPTLDQSVSDPKLFCCHKVFDQIYQDSSVNACHESSASLDGEISENLMRIYPNPTDKKALLQIPSFEKNSYIITFFNNVGRAVDIKLVATGTGCEINTSGIASGVYQVILRHKNGVVSNKKLVIQH